MLLEELREALQPLILQYQQLTHKDLFDFYDRDTGTLSPEHMLDVMNSFHRLSPIRQFGQIHWRCPCTWGFRHKAFHHTALFSALWDPDVRVPSDLSEVFPQRKGKTVSTVFNYDKVFDEEECEQQPVWKPKITGIDNPVTPPPAAKRWKGAVQKSKALSYHDKSKAIPEPDTDDSDFKIAADAKKGASGLRHKLDLAARPSSQPVLSPSLYIVIYLLAYVPHRRVWMTHSHCSKLSTGAQSMSQCMLDTNNITIAHRFITRARRVAGNTKGQRRCLRQGHEAGSIVHPGRSSDGVPDHAQCLATGIYFTAPECIDFILGVRRLSVRRGRRLDTRLERTRFVSKQAYGRCCRLASFLRT